MDETLRNRFEGSIFFAYDRHFLQREEDRLEDAIIYFYPHSMPIDTQCRLCGQLMGVVQFSHSMFNSYPTLFRFNNEKIAIKHVGKYSLAMAGSSSEPDSALLATLDRLYFLFSFYHGSIDQVVLECENNREKFIPEISVIFEQYLAFIRNYGDHLPSVFNPIPYLPLKNDPNFFFLKASHILESCQRRPQIVAGSVLYNRYLLCSQLTECISRCLLLLKPNQHHHPAMPIETDYQLPFGVRLFHVYLKPNDLRQILQNNQDNSPYQSQSETSSLPRCCCSGNGTPGSRTPRSKTPRMPSFVTPEPVIKVDEVFIPSEKDPFSSSSNSGPKLCKAMLEDLILKGFKCCKCIDETDGEFDNGSSFENSSDGEGMQESCKARNGFIYSTDGIHYNAETEESREADAQSRNNSLHSRNLEHVRNNFQNSSLEPESGIEVTGSDFHSSAATHFDQHASCFKDHHPSFQKDSQNSNEHFKRKMAGSDGIKVGSGFATRENREVSRMSGEVEGLMKNSLCEEKNKHHMLHGGIDKHVKNMSEDKIETIMSEDVSKMNQPNETNSTSKEDENSDKMSDVSSGKVTQHVNGADALNKSSKQLWHSDKQQQEISHHEHSAPCGIFNGDVISDISPEDDAETLDEMPHHLYNKNLEIPADEQYQLSSSEDSYRTPDELLGTYDSSEESSQIAPTGVSTVVDGHQEGVDVMLDLTQDVIHMCKGDKDAGSLGSNDEGECSKEKEENERQKKCCEVDGMIHANLFVQAHSEIVLILLAKCDLYQNEDAVRSLWNTSLSQLGELDILMKNSVKENKQDVQSPLNLLIYDNFEKTMSGNLREPVFAPDHVFCETAKILHDQFNNAPQLFDVTLRNFFSGIHSERTLSKEAYYHEPMNNAASSNLSPNISGYLAERMRNCIAKDHDKPSFC